MREFSEQEIVRREKIEEIKKYTNPYPERYEVTHSLKEASLLPDEEKDVSVAGRIVFMRKMGKLSFLKLRDIEADLQVSMKIDLVGEEKYSFFKANIDVGDFIGVKGEMFTTQTGEKTLRAESFEFLGKALKPLPEKFHGLTDPELCYRNRYVDMIMNEDTRKRFLIRFKFIKELRNYLDNLGYYEIETPILNNHPSGAIARPFISHHNALDLDVYLRIAPETYMKRAVVAGIPKVYEIARCFRNEGMDTTHLQDFTMIECYQAYFNYEDNMKLIREMLQSVICKIFGTLEISIAGKIIDLSGNWPKVSFRDLILKYANIDINIYNTKEKLLEKIKLDNIELDSETPIENLGFGNLVDYLYKKVARPYIIEPIYLVNHPSSLSPLARTNDNDSSISDRFQLVINGAEIVNGYSELVDPMEQERKLQEQASLKQNGDEEAMEMDYDYIGAMEYGMPPISGWGMGIDRVVQLITNSENIKDVVMFPLMRPNE
ncbi:MAG: lysine--tRNA ligase [Clostridium sp.]|nr:lysine--tRNA ligase [Clostridium sp.]MCM1444744.1 lysine--tRNA ligase [Candidatus Amulumruptor caecigallinarius]